ncbi:MAG TPA: helix-turn-helix domain-containing protein [Candidatus Saccharimonadales bacterium]
MESHPLAQADASLSDRFGEYLEAQDQAIAAWGENHPDALTLQVKALSLGLQAGALMLREAGIRLDASNLQVPLRPLKISEAAVILGVSTSSIRRWTNNGDLRSYRTPGNQRRFNLADVLDVLQAE